MKIPVNIQRILPNTPLPEYQTPGAVGFDLAVQEGGLLAPGERRLFPTGLVVEVPQGYALLVMPRSSNSKKGLMLTNSVGVIDQDYHGPENQIFLSLYNADQKPYLIEAGERLAQGLIVPVAIAQFEEVVFDAPNRGSFGSTG